MGVGGVTADRRVAGKRRSARDHARRNEHPLQAVPATETQFTEGYVDIDGTTVQLRGVRVSRAEMMAIADHLRRATARQWNALDRQPAHAVGSEIVAGTIVQEGTVGSASFGPTRRCRTSVTTAS